MSPFRPNPSYAETDSQPFRFIIKNFSWSAVAGGVGGGGENIFSPGLEPAVSGCRGIEASRSCSSGKSTFTSLYAVKQLR